MLNLALSAQGGKIFDELSQTFPERRQGQECMTDHTGFGILRERAGLTISELAERSGRSPRTIYRWENGETKPDKLVADYLKRIADAPTILHYQSPSLFTFIDLFAGIGGMRQAFESVNGMCVFTSEWNKYSRQTYLANFPAGHPVVGDITQIEESAIPEHDVLLAGFPCQPFSIAGVSKKKALGMPHGFKDLTQGNLFFDITRILDYHKPQAFLLENVKNLANHDKGTTFRIISDTLKELGSSISWRVINAKGFVPQNRERIFIVGFREVMHSDFDFNALEIPDAESGPKLGTILHPEDGTEEEEPPYTFGEQGLVADKYTLTPKLWKYLQDYAIKHKEKGNGFGFGLVTPHDTARTLSARYYKDGSEILVAQPGKFPRRLTPRECARLMGFDRPERPPFEIPVSDTQAYKQFGNAVVVPVVKAIAKHMLAHVLGNRDTATQTALQPELPF